MKTEEELRHEMEIRQRAPYYWPELQSIMQLFLAGAIVAMVWYILQQLLSGEALKIDPSVRDLIVFIFGIVFGNFKDVYSFTFGSSASDKSKGDVINKSIETKDKIIAAGVANAAEVAATAIAPDTNLPVPPWWARLTDDEKNAITTAAANDPRVAAFITAAQTGAANADDLAYLVTTNPPLLTQARADEIKTKQPKEIT